VIPAEKVEFIRWTETNEVETIAGMDIGIMPLADDLWSRGKCSYKMLLYMACGLPVVVSEYGMNRDVLARGFIGYGAVDDEGWYESLAALVKDPEARVRAGQNGRDIIERHYSLDVVCDLWAMVIGSVAPGKGTR
ncbi:TPA: glycosyltransferase, partial [Pseudomonas aeruginosa]|nr:glycosyltransferase [Pseudomonas aeruginosa]HCE6454102.1 glycosyltransferase [Pseudomonas aeruginosa]